MSRSHAARANRCANAQPRQTNPPDPNDATIHGQYSMSRFHTESPT
jgi:hypothetical protein